MTATSPKALAVACPECDAEPGQRCWDLRHGRVAKRYRVLHPHWARARAARQAGVFGRRRYA